MATHPFPGTVVRFGDPRTEVVEALQARLVEVGCGPLVLDGVFGRGTESAVRLFQTRHGALADGMVGPLTWALLFPAPQHPSTPPAPLLRAVLESAASQLGVKESGGSNRGPQVDEYLRAVAVDPASGDFPWCAAFLYWNFRAAATRLGVPNPCVKTASCMALWVGSARRTRIAAPAALDHPELITPGAIFVIDHGHGRGHVGLVESLARGVLRTIEGNTNDDGSRDGYGVFRRDRSIAQINLGFVNYAV